MVHSSNVVDISDDDASAFNHDFCGPTGPTMFSTSIKPKKRKVDATVEDEVIEWTDDSDEVGYEAFKRHKKRGAAATRKAKGKAVAKAPVASKRKTAKTKFAPNDDGTSSEDEDGLPGYIQKRRHEVKGIKDLRLEDFDQGIERLRQAGLALPPTYEDVDFSDDERVDKLEEKPRFDERSGIKPSREYRDVLLSESGGVIPASIAQYLRDYQVEGVRFLHHLFVFQQGGILGDDMGLGKTVQVAAFLTAMFGKSGDQRDAKRMRKFKRVTDRWYPRVLIICPGSLTQNWKQELDRWGWWVTDLYHGANKDDVLGTASAGQLEIMITTYTTYKNNCNGVNRTAWDCVVADECHCIKDPSAEVTKAMNDVNALCRIGLTGTAIQNRYEELWTLLNWTNPGLFGTRSEWKHTISTPLTIGQSHDATFQQLSKARNTAKKLVENLLPRFFLRRMKSLIAHQLPKKSDKVVFCPLSDLQREAYENFLKSPLVDIVKTAYKPCGCGSQKKRGFCCYQVTEDGESWKSLVFPMVMSLQKLSSHLTLLIPQHSDTIDKHNRGIRYLQAAMPDRWQQLYNQRDSLLSLANPEFCGKWAVLKKLLRFWYSNGDKVLVFSHSVRLLRILQHLFNNTSYSVSYLDGSLSYEERQNTVDDFNSDPKQFVFLISTKAGGVGLNITSANKVVIMDPHWNPAYDLQAQDRAYRIGQVRDVDVYRLISTGTIEEITYARQIYKQQQANIGYTASNERRYFKGVQHKSDQKGEIFGIDNLFSFHADQVMLRDIVNKTNIAEARADVSLMDVDMDQAVQDVSENGLIKKEEDLDHGDGGLSQLAATLTKEEKSGPSGRKASQKRKSDVIQAILVSAGVEYTHENSEVVGSSKVEDRLSRHAELEANQDQAPTGRAVFLSSHDAGVYAGADPGNLSFVYNPPENVLQRQFCTMAKTFGFPSATDFALAVESMTQEQRRNTLDLFYKKRMDRLKELGDVKLEVDEKLKMEVKDEAKEEANAKPIRSEDEKSLKLPNADANGENQSVSYNADIKVKKDEASFITGKTPSTSIWLSDDDETDEL
ncbi:P-loop containing nucleoside triphosphate hydrolase protein [Xylariales sp. AK1849]|nr:P-loop containing nucleoside triphosphate hydrolase protein [Xylariales sp. AK1849]